MFEKYSEVYDLLYSDKNTKLEVEYLNNVLGSLNLINADVLEYGSGTGRHAVELTKYGHNIYGVELSEEMVKRAHSAPGFECEVGDILQLDLGKKFDCVISMFHVASYQNTNDQILKFFSSAARHLNVGGKLIFDFWYSPAVIYNRPEVRCKFVENDTYAVWRIAEPEEDGLRNIINVKYTIFVKNKKTDNIKIFTELHPMRHFSIPELEMLSNICGFKLQNSAEYMTDEQPSRDSWGVISVFEKV